MLALASTSLFAQLQHDSNNDGCVGTEDLLSLLSEFGACDTDSVYLYYFQGGATAYPYSVNMITSSVFYTPAIQDGSATIDDAMAYLIENAGNEIPSPGGGQPYTVFELPISGDLSTTTESWTYPGITGGDRYYMIVPSSEPGFGDDLTYASGTNPIIDVTGGETPIAFQFSRSFTYNGSQWTLYEIGYSSDLSNEYRFNN